MPLELVWLATAAVWGGLSASAFLAGFATAMCLSRSQARSAVDLKPRADGLASELKKTSRDASQGSLASHDSHLVSWERICEHSDGRTDLLEADLSEARKRERRTPASAASLLAPAATPRWSRSSSPV